MADKQALRVRLTSAEAVVSRLVTKCQESESTALDNISVVVVKRRLTTFEQAIQEHQQACAALEQLKEDVAESVTKVDGYETKATIIFNNLINKGTTRTCIRTIELMLATVEKEIGYDIILSKEITTIADAIRGMNIMRAQPGSMDCAALTTLAEGIISRHRELQKKQLKGDLKPKDEAEAGTKAVYINPGQGLPLVIPPFDGQFLSWKRWWNTFSGIMKENPHLTKYSQRCHFITAMASGEAKEFALKTFELEETHEDAIKEIKAKYEDKRTLHQHYHKNYFVRETVESTRPSLEKFSDKFKSTFKAFTDCQVNTAGQVMIMHALQQFNSHLLSQWKKHNKKLKFTPTYEVMTEFLKDQIECLGAEAPTYSTGEGSKKHRYKSQNTATALQTRPEGQTIVCPLCQGSHYVAFCPKFDKK